MNGFKFNDDKPIKFNSRPKEAHYADCFETQVTKDIVRISFGTMTDIKNKKNDLYFSCYMTMTSAERLCSSLRLAINQCKKR